MSTPDVMLAGHEQHGWLRKMWDRNAPTWPEYLRSLMPWQMEVHPIPKRKGKTHAQRMKQTARNRRRYRVNGERRRHAA